MQDNLEFLQWIKKFWEQHAPSEFYDADAARRRAGNDPPSGGSGAANRSTTTSKRVTSVGTFLYLPFLVIFLDELCCSLVHAAYIK